MEPPNARRRRAAHLAPYFELQLRFAAELARRADVPLSAAVRSATNLRRRFGHRDTGSGPEPPPWTAFLAALDDATTLDEHVACAQAAYVAGGEERAPRWRQRFGCFACDPPEADGTVRIHFSNRDAADGTSPLTTAKAARRRAELRALTEHVHTTHLGARTVQGGSWLYHLEAYRRLFPPAYVASRHVVEPVRLNGMSSWGQVLDHQERVKRAPRDALLANLAALDPAAPWRVFPLRPLRASAPVEVFLDFYGVA
jgi:hypothetical protein